MISPGVIAYTRLELEGKYITCLSFVVLNAKLLLPLDFWCTDDFHTCGVLFCLSKCEQKERQRKGDGLTPGVVNKGNYFADVHRQPLTCRQEQTERQRTYWARNCIRIYSVPGFLLRWQLIELLFCLFKRKKRSKIATKKGKERE